MQVQTCGDTCTRGLHIWMQSALGPSANEAGAGAEWCAWTLTKKKWAERQCSSLTAAVTRDVTEHQPVSRCRSGVFGQTGRYCVAVVQFAQYERVSNSIAVNLKQGTTCSNEPSNRLTTSDVTKAYTGDFVDGQLRCQLGSDGQLTEIFLVKLN